MSQFPTSEPVEAIVAHLAEALDWIDIGIVLLNRNLHVQFINQRFAEILAWPPGGLAKDTSFRMLLEHTAANVQFGVPAGELPAYLDQREAAVRAPAASSAEIDLRDGRRFLLRSSPCDDGGRILTYCDITPLKHEQDALNEVREAAERTIVEQRFSAETLEDQAEYLVSLAETADENARQAAAANERLEHEIAERQQLEAELRRLVTTDTLTGTLSRAHFLSLAENAFERARQFNQELAVLMLDIDYFKHINDSFGHFVGDEVLKHFVAQLRTGMRSNDLLGRLGGEEFAVVLEATDPQTGLLVGERLRTRVADAPLVYGDRTIGVTVSIGLATACDDDQTIAQTLARADAMLYAAKSNGRNQVCAEVATAAPPCADARRDQQRNLSSARA
ncbi:MAG TPA: diguanylate cyclase [Acetobacteraceae bacterium]|nr:diguanylate cyclase [Acetobacteraceae bacterium]